MADQPWGAVDKYLCDLLLEPDSSLDAALGASRESGLPEINVAPNQGKLLNLLVRTLGATSVLEIGTLGGYSTIWMARALPESGRLITLEAVPKHASVAQGEPRAGRGRRAGRDQDRCSAGQPKAAGRQGCRAVRLHLHRRRQGEHPSVLRVVSEPGPRRHLDLRRQPGP